MYDYDRAYYRDVGNWGGNRDRQPAFGMDYGRRMGAWMNRGYGDEYRRARRTGPRGYPAEVDAERTFEGERGMRGYGRDYRGSDYGRAYRSRRFAPRERGYGRDFGDRMRSGWRDVQRGARQMFGRDDRYGYRGRR